jgi:hypothetical protein
MFLKKGVNKAQGQNIYPHPNQTGTGNCAAYTGAACLYAFGLDHESALIPQPAGNPPAGEKFQWQMHKMIERLTDLIYKDGNSIAEGYRKYIDEVGLNCKFDVSEQPLTSYEYDSLAGEYRHVTRMPWLIDQMKQCQDIMLHIKYGGAWYNPFKTTHRHSVGLVGVDEATHELIINNPWGGSTHVNPDDAAANTQNQTGDRFTRHRWRVDGDGYVYFPFGGDDDNFVYEVVMICPVQEHAVAVRGESHALEPGEAFAALQDAPRRQYEYTVTNNQLQGVHGLAIQLPGLQAANVVATAAPADWTAGIWYRERELGFDHLAPEITLDERGETFAGVIWRRTGERGIAKGDSLGGFRIDIQFPVEDETERARWHDDPLGHAVVLQEMGRTPQAWHVSTLAPRKRPLRIRPILDRESESDRPQPVRPPKKG